MAAYNKFFPFVQDVGRKVHNLNSDTLNLALFTASVAPTTADGLFDTSTTHQLNSSGSTEVAAGNGYTAGGATVGTTAYSQTSGTATLSGIPASPTWTASSAGFALRYVALYNATGGSAGARPLIGWWDYGSTLTLSGANGDTFTVSFSGNTIFTLA